MDSGSTATDNFIIIGMSPKPTSDDDLYMKPNTKIENNDKTGEESNKHSTTTKIGDSSNDDIVNKSNEHLWFKDQQQPILADIFKQTQDVYF